MKKKINKILAFVLSVIMTFGTMPMINVFAVEIVDSGSCGDTIAWILDDEGTLIISGEGEMNEIPYYPSWYDNRSLINRVVIKYGITNIRENAFYGCSNLKSIAIPDSVTNIDCEAFVGCSALTSVTIPDSVKIIYDRVFMGCDSLKNINVAENNINYSSQDGVLFNKNKTELIQYPAGNSRTTYNIPDSVTSIVESSFHGCSNLAIITIPNGVTNIGNSAFYGCVNLKNVTIPQKVTSLSASIFGNCQSLTSITMHDNVKNIGFSAFYNCSSLKSVTIPCGVISIEDYVFFGCKSLISISVDENNKNYFSQDGVLFNKDKTKLIQYPAGNDRIIYDIPNSVTSIGTGAFYDCTSLTSVTIPDSVLYIGHRAFGECKNLTSVIIPESTKHIDSFAFGYIDFGYVYGEAVKLPDFTIYGYNNTAAEKYATENGFTFISLTSHTFTEWKVEKEATVFEEGLKVRSCTVCSYTETETIDKIPSSTVVDDDTSVSIIYPNEAFDGDVEIEVEQQFDGSTFQVLDKDGYAKFELFDITIKKDGESVQPNKPVWVKIPLPEGYNSEKTVIYHVTNTGKLEKMNSYIENGYIYFEATHFSDYVVLDESAIKDPTPPPAEPTKPCDCKCHSSGFSLFIWKIGNFFHKIFKMDKYYECACGEKHW